MLLLMGCLGYVGNVTGAYLSNNTSEVSRYQSDLNATYSTMNGLLELYLDTLGPINHNRSISIPTSGTPPHSFSPKGRDNFKTPTPNGTTYNKTESLSNLRWYWQLDGPLRLDINATIYDVDLFETTEEEIAALHRRGVTVICYFSAGTWEEWRPDAHLFPKRAIGKPMEDWEGEYWLDVHEYPLFAGVMEKRMDMAVEKECDGIEPDNIDAYAHDTGFNIDIDDSKEYFLWLSREAHKRGLFIALKNSPEMVRDVVDSADLAIVEECLEYGECEAYMPFVQSGKPVLAVEYERDKEVCGVIPEGFSLDLACPELNGCWEFCDVR